MFGVLPSQLAGYDPGSTTKKGKLPINRPVSSKSNLRPSSAKVSTPYSWSNWFYLWYENKRKTYIIINKYKPPLWKIIISNSQTLLQAYSLQNNQISKVEQSIIVE